MSAEVRTQNEAGHQTDHGTTGPRTTGPKKGKTKNVKGRRRVLIDGQTIVFESKADGCWCYPIRSRTHWRAGWKEIFEMATGQGRLFFDGKTEPVVTRTLKVKGRKGPRTTRPRDNGIPDTDTERSAAGRDVPRSAGGNAISIYGSLE